MIKQNTNLTWLNAPLILSVEQTAFLLGLNTEMIINYCEKKELPAVKFGRNWKIDKEKLMKMFGYNF